MTDESRVVIVDLADDLHVRKQRLFKVMAKLGIRSVLRREASKHGQKVATVTQVEANSIRQVLARPELVAASQGNSTPDECPPYVVGDEVGVFYVMQLEPQHDPGRFKVGFTAELEGRLRKHRTSAPFAQSVKTWSSRRVWERAAIDCVTSGCEQLHTEVFRTSSIADVLRRGDDFFAMMPDPHRKVALEEQSLAKEEAGEQTVAADEARLPSRAVREPRR